MYFNSKFVNTIDFIVHIIIINLIFNKNETEN